MFFCYKLCGIENQILDQVLLKLNFSVDHQLFQYYAENSDWNVIDGKIILTSFTGRSATRINSTPAELLKMYCTNPISNIPTEKCVF